MKKLLSKKDLPEAVFYEFGEDKDNSLLMAYDKTKKCFAVFGDTTPGGQWFYITKDREFYKPYIEFIEEDLNV